MPTAQELTSCAVYYTNQGNAFQRFGEIISDMISCTHLKLLGTILPVDIDSTLLCQKPPSSEAN